MSMNEYRKLVRDLADKRDGTPIYNSSLDHAAVLAEAMFEFGHKEVCIFSGKLNPNVYGTRNLIERASMFLADPETRVRVLVEHPEQVDVDEHPFVCKFKEREDVSFHGLNDDVKEKIEFHYVVMDSDSYRFESDKNSPTAIAAFGDKKGGENLSRVFDSLWKISTKLV